MNLYTITSLVFCQCKEVSKRKSRILCHKGMWSRKEMWSFLRKLKMGLHGYITNRVLFLLQYDQWYSTVALKPPLDLSSTMGLSSNLGWCHCIVHIWKVISSKKQSLTLSPISSINPEGKSPLLHELQVSSTSVAFETLIFLIIICSISDFSTRL